MSSILIPDSVVTIDDNAFSGCDALTSITLPSSTTYIDTWAFGWCASLSTIVFEGDAPVIDGPPFAGVTATAYYPNGNPTWTDSIQERYGESLTWIDYEPDIKYHVNLTLYKTDANDPIAIIPDDKFVANVKVSRLTATEDDIVIIAFYSPEGKFSGISVFKLTEDKNQTITLECDNSNGRLGNIKVFVIDSLFNPEPLAKTSYI